MSHLSLKGGLERLSRKDYAAVHKDCLSAIEAKKDGAIAVFLLGVIAFDHGNFGKARELFEKAETLNPSEPYFSGYLAMTLSTLRRSRLAQKAADHAARFKIADAHLSDMLGVIYSRCGFHERAISHFKKAVAQNKSEPNYFFNLAASQQFLGDFGAAEASYRQTLSLDPKNYRAWSSLTSLKKQTSQSHNLDTLKEAFASQTLDPDAKLHLGHAIAKTLEDLGQHEDSL